jgi:hypothetical protein
VGESRHAGAALVAPGARSRRNAQEARPARGRPGAPEGRDARGRAKRRRLRPRPPGAPLDRRDDGEPPQRGLSQPAMDALVDWVYRQETGKILP